MFSFKAKGPASKASEAKPLRLVYADGNGVFHMDPEALSALQQVKGPVGVVSVCGRARQGKSFLLNQLLGQSSGFKVAPTHKPCTKGLWMWSKPVERTLPDGSTYYIVFLDSEGIDAYDQTGTYSTQIFSLAVLLSSMFIYNQMGPIDEAALDRLSLVTEMTRHIRVRAMSADTSSSSSVHQAEEELAEFSPSFIWLLRDFYLDMSEDGRRLSAKDYLETALRPTLGTTKAVMAKNQIRESIRSLFPLRECYTLVRPMNEEKDLQHLEQIPVERMRPEFQEGLKSLVSHILSRARPKQMGATMLTGSMLATLTMSFLEAINSGAVPTIATSWQSVEESECRKAADAAMTEYETAFNTDTKPEESSIASAHEVAVKAALAVFNKLAVGSPLVRRGFEDSLQASVSRHYQSYKERVFAQAELNCNSLLGAAEARIAAAGREGRADYAELVKLIGREVTEYVEKASGPAKWERLANFLLQSLSATLSESVRRSCEALSAAKREVDARVTALEDRARVLEQECDAARQSAKAWEARYESTNSALSTARDEAAAAQRLVAQLQERAVAEGRRADEAEKRVKREEERIAELDGRLSTAGALSEVHAKEAGDWRDKYWRAVEEQRAAAERSQTLNRTLEEEVAVKARHMSDMEAKVRELSAQLEVLRAQNQSVQREKEAALAAERVRADGLSLRLQEAEHKGGQSAADAVQAAARVGELLMTINELRAQRDRDKESASKAAAEAAAAAEALRLAREALESERMSTHSFRLQLQESECKVTQLEQKLRGAEDGAEALHRQIDAARREEREVRERCRVLEAEGRSAAVTQHQRSKRGGVTADGDGDEEMKEDAHAQPPASKRARRSVSGEGWAGGGGGASGKEPLHNVMPLPSAPPYSGEDGGHDTDANDGDDDDDDSYRKMTMQKLKRALTKAEKAHVFLNNPKMKKNELLQAYKDEVLSKRK